MHWSHLRQIQSQFCSWYPIIFSLCELPEEKYLIGAAVDLVALLADGQEAKVLLVPVLPGLSSQRCLAGCRRAGQPGSQGRGKNGLLIFKMVLYGAVNCYKAGGCLPPLSP